MQKIVFETDYSMPIESITTFGVNSKPNSESPIGFFGTGLKYAIAVIMRLGGGLRMILDGEEYNFTKEIGNFRGKDFEFIFMNDMKLPFTTELGKNWEPWMVIRELQSNTQDEGGVSYLAGEKNVPSGKTIIEVDNPILLESYNNDVIFRPESKLICQIGPVYIYEGPSDYIFYKGLRITDLQKPSKFTYDFQLGIFLTEDRTSKYPYADINTIMNCIACADNEELIKEIITLDKEWLESEFPWDNMIGNTAGTFIKCLIEAKDKMCNERLRIFLDNWTKKDEVDSKVSIKMERDEWETIIGLISWQEPELAKRIEDQL